MRMTTFAALALALGIPLTGCGEVFDVPPNDDDERASKHLAQGYTPCGDEPHQTYGVICHPNQYCSSQRFARCSTGCLSNDNCTEEQRCAKSDGRDIGTCVDLDAEADESDGLDPGYTRCGDGAYERTCHPNHYCADDYWADCEIGCVSNDNCTNEQRCEKAGHHVGTCVERGY